MKTIVQKIANKELEAAIVYRSTDVIAFADHSPINHGHLLICPVHPYKAFIDLPLAVHEEIQEVARTLYVRINEHFEPDGISFIQNNGDFNELGHYHLHIFPRYHADKFGWTSSNLGQQAIDDLQCTIAPLIIDAV
jgi:histidine triad (HIT) family protein